MNKQKGMTLIELVAAIAILGIVIGAIFTLFMTGVNYFRVGNSRSQAQNEARQVANSILASIKYASNLEIMTQTEALSLIDAATNSEPNGFYLVQNGILYQKWYDDQTHAYKDKVITGMQQNYLLNFERIPSDPSMLRITISITKSTETVEVKSDISLDNFILDSNRKIIGDESGAAIYYQISPPG